MRMSSKNQTNRCNRKYYYFFTINIKKHWSLWNCNSAVTFSFFFASLIVLNTKLIFCSVPVFYATILLSNKSLMIDKYNIP